jgi:hypothetical protein
MIVVMDQGSDTLHVGEGVEVPGLVGSDSEVDHTGSEAVPDELRKLSVTHSHYYQLLLSSTHQVG